MTGPDGGRLLVLSSRYDILSGVEDAARALDPAPEVAALVGWRGDFGPADLVLVDAAEPGATPSFLRARLGVGPRLVALLDAAVLERLGDALTGDWYDYLFYPISGPELGLVWRRHRSTGPAPALTLDVDDEGRIRLTMPSLVEILRPAVERVVEAARHLAGLDRDAAFRVRVALGEAVANAVLYGSGEDPDRLVRIDLETASGELRVRVTDDGSGFDPTAVPDPTTAAGVERNRGRGLFLMRSLTDELRFNETGNEVTLIFRGALDPLARLAPLMPPYAELTGLRFRIETTAEGGSEPVYDGLGDALPAGEGIRVSRAVGGGRGLRVVYDRVRPESGGGESDADRAAELLAGFLEVLAVGDVARERWVRRRLRRERVLAELEVARDLQLRLLPPAEGFEDLAGISARCDPALSLGGDFYFLSRQPGGRLGVMLGDVSSHGPSAALIMALTLSSAAMATKAHETASGVLSGMQEQLLRALESTEMYMTLFYAVVDREGETVSYANAGHPYAYRIGPAGPERLAALDTPIGMSAPQGYAEETVAWPRDDATLLLFTDGLAGDLSDPLDRSGSPVRRALDAGERDPGRLVSALFEGIDDDMRLDDRTAVAVRP